MSRRIDMLSRLFAILMLLSLVLAGLPVTDSLTSASSTLARTQDFDSDGSVWVAAVEGDGYVYYEEDGDVICRPATAEEARAMSERDEQLPMRVLNPEGLTIQMDGELNIVLRGTQQLDSFPQARDGFLRAAETWKSRLRARTPITIIIDVDYGTTRFGQSFPQGVLGSTSSQSLGNSNGFVGLRQALIQGASNATEAALYNALPETTVPTNLGNTTSFVLPSAPLRALGLINAVADPAAEQAQFGSPPSIGFNSNFVFDFDPSDGIDLDKTDFDAVAVHEIGHVLGFSSRVGVTELSPGAGVSVSILDLLRFRPGVTMGTFTNAQRPLSSGGEHQFFAGLQELPLSTGRPDGSGGDGNQPSHWKDNLFLGTNIGIMDPRLARGERAVITDNDLHAYDAFGYSLPADGGGGGNGAPSIASVSGSLRGDVLTLSGTVTDPQGDIMQAEVTFLNSAGNVIGQNPPVGVNSGGATSFNYNFQVNGLSDLPAATRARLVFIDGQGNRSFGSVADFSLADAGGPSIKNVTHNGAKLVIKGGSLIGQLQIEINGVIVGGKNNAANGKVKIKGSLASFNIRSGSNRVRVLKGDLRSNIFVAQF